MKKSVDRILVEGGSPEIKLLTVKEGGGDEGPNLLFYKLLHLGLINRTFLCGNVLGLKSNSHRKISK